jgi:hypothetical protein
MRKATMLVIGAVMLLSSALLAATAAATTPANETILLRRDLSDFAEVDWSASGAFVDSGNWTSDGAAFGNGHITLFTTETGSAGSFRLLFQGLEKLPNHPFSGNWQIIDGTGAYATLQGQGKWTVDVPVPPNTVETFTLTGGVHFD